MKFNIDQPIKIVDNFFEIPSLWRNYGLKQKFTKDESGYPGYKSPPLNEIDSDLFHHLASKIIIHATNKNYFQLLKIQFAYSLLENTQEIIGPHVDERFYNIAGLIYLQHDAPLNVGTIFFRKNEKSEVIPTVEVENIYNRMIIFDPNVFHMPAGVFGNTLENSRLTITFFGTAI